VETTPVVTVLPVPEVRHGEGQQPASPRPQPADDRQQCEDAHGRPDDTAQQVACMRRLILSVHHVLLLGRELEFARRQMGLPDLGGDEDLVALDARCAQAVAHLALVVVHLGGVDMAIAEPQRLLDHARAGAPAHLPGPEPDRRYLGALGLDEDHGGFLW